MSSYSNLLRWSWSWVNWWVFVKCEPKSSQLKGPKYLNYFSLCALNLFNTRVSQFMLNYWNKWTFPRHSNLRCTCIRSLIWTGIMAEYLVMSTSQGTYDIRSNRAAGRDTIYSTYEMCRAGRARGLGMGIVKVLTVLLLLSILLIGPVL